MDLGFGGCFLSVPKTHMILGIEASSPRTLPLEHAFLVQLFPSAALDRWPSQLPPGFSQCSCHLHPRVN